MRASKSQFKPCPAIDRAFPYVVAFAVVVAIFSGFNFLIEKGIL